MLNIITPSKNPTVVFETNTRTEFIKVCHILAKGLPPSLQSTIIGVSGGFDIGKSLIADAILNALDDFSQKYNVPKQNKMTLEVAPGEALDHPIIKKFMSQKLVTQFNFTRSRYNIPLTDVPRQICILSHNDLDVLRQSSLLISLIKPIGSNEKRQDFRRKWTVTVLKKELYTPTMQEQVEHLRAFHARRLYKRSLDLQ